MPDQEILDMQMDMFVVFLDDAGGVAQGEADVELLGWEECAESMFEREVCKEVAVRRQHLCCRCAFYRTAIFLFLCERVRLLS